MHGIVWRKDDGGDGSTRVLQGGSWNFLQIYACSADRGGSGPDLRGGDIGFVARAHLTPLDDAVGRVDGGASQGPPVPREAPKWG